MSDFRLKAFYSVAKNLSFTKASQELFVSQPAVTKHVRELESLYQVRLFDRLGNKISLTEAGRVLLEHCERILQEYRKLEFDMHLLNMWDNSVWGPAQPLHNMYYRRFWPVSRRNILK